MAFPVILWINFCCLFSHPVYVSVTNMDIDVPKKNIIMSLRIFTDDMETVLHNKYGIDGWIGTPHEHKDCRRLINEYVDERFMITVNHQEKLSLLTDSMVIHKDALWIYKKGNAPEIIRHLEINNRILTDFFFSQTNLVIISTGNKEKGYNLNRKKHIIELSL